MKCLLGLTIERMRTIDIIILGFGSVAIIFGLILLFIPDTLGAWGIGCFGLGGFAFLGE